MNAVAKFARRNAGRAATAKPVGCPLCEHGKLTRWRECLWCGQPFFCCGACDEQIDAGKRSEVCHRCLPRGADPARVIKRHVR